MKEKINIPIVDLILKEENIIELAKYLFNQENKQEVNYRIIFKNKQEIEGDDISLFQNRKFKEYEIDFIHMKYYSKEYEDKIEIYLYNNDMSGISSIEITSINNDWFAITEKAIEEILSYCDKQNKIGCIFRNMAVGGVLALVMAIISACFCGNFANELINSEREIGIIVGLICFNIFYILNSFLFRNLEKAFPKIEMAISDKNNSSKSKRANIVGIFTSLILPVAVNLIYDLIKYAI